MINDIIEDFKRLFVGERLYESIREANEMDTTNPLNGLLSALVPMIGLVRVSIFLSALSMIHYVGDKLLPQSQHPYNYQIRDYLSEEYAKKLRIENRIGGSLPEEFFEKDGTTLYVVIDGKQTKDYQDILRYFGK